MRFQKVEREVITINAFTVVRIAWMRRLEVRLSVKRSRIEAAAQTC